MLQDRRLHLEGCIIGALLNDTLRAYPILAQASVSEVWFCEEYHQNIFREARAHYSKGMYLDALHALNLLPCPPSYRMNVLDLVGSTDALPSYIETLRGEVLRERALKLLKAGQESLQVAETADDAIRSLKQSLCDLDRFTVVPEVTIEQHARNFIDSCQNPPTAGSVEWPFAKLRNAMGRMSNELVYVCSRPSVGKTALTLQWMCHLKKVGSTPALASLESKKNKLVMRLLTMLSGVNALRALNGHASQLDYERMEQAYQSLVQMKLMVTDNSMNMDQLHAWAQLKKEEGANIIFVDNMKHVRPLRRYPSPVEFFRETSEHIKWMRDDLNIPVVVLHHLNREQGVSWSDDVERDADVLAYLEENEASSKKPTPENLYTAEYAVDFNIKKCRDGVRDVKDALTFTPSRQLFCETQPIQEIE